MPQIIIIGAARSGTKFLRSVLAASDAVATVRYDVNYIWREGNESSKDDELHPASIDDSTRENIRCALYAQAGIGTHSFDCSLLEKSVPNSLRLPFVDSVFPNAKYLHIVRDGREVVESAYRSWHQRPQLKYLVGKLRSFPLRHWRYGIRYARNFGSQVAAARHGKIPGTWGPRYRGIDEDLRLLPVIQVVARQWARCVSNSMEAFSSIPKERWMQIRYEDLIQSENAIRNVADFLDLCDINNVIAEYRSSLRPPQGSGCREVLNEQERSIAFCELKGGLSRLGYL